YLLSIEYETFAAGAVTVEGFTVPFGLASPAEAFLGSALWLQDSFDLSTVLLRCDRFCAHPTFDSAGVYNVQLPFADTFRSQCYVPRFPEPPGAEFPLDP